MGQLINGVWTDQPLIINKDGGEFKRNASSFRHWISRDGSTGFKAEAGRYHLYVSLACPWASRAIIFRKLKKLEDVISMSIVSPIMLENGWTFEEYPGSTPDTIHNMKFLHQIYSKADPSYTGRVTVPVLWDKKQNTIVNNESAEIIRMLNSEFNEFGDATTDFYPVELREKIDEINHFVYSRVNNGVYKCGFATEQEPYSVAFDQLFSALDEIETRLSLNDYLVGSFLTEADWRLFTTLVRFDAVYYSHFKCNFKQLKDYPQIQNYMINLYKLPGISSTVNMDHIKTHYYVSQKTINPTGIVPKGPHLEWL